MIQYRTFLNGDPPQLVEVWNAGVQGRAASHPRTHSWFEYFVFAKPYFDPNGLIVASVENRIVAFALAGFGPNEAQTALDTTKGIVCALVVHPEHRRKGIGSELLRRSESYLISHGATTLRAGPFRALNPFTFGLYGGCDSLGFLESDPDSRPFLERHGYRPAKSGRIFQHSLKKAPSAADGRFAAHRLRYEIHGGPCAHPSWWTECVSGPVELHEFRLVDKLTRRSSAHLVAWEMETYNERWQQQSIGVLRLEVQPELRRQGLGKFLLVQVMHHVREQFFSLIEAAADTDNDAGQALLRRIGFEQVDVGHGYLKS